MALEPGRIVQERYRIERLLGRGGMGAVYQATDIRLNHLVALKENLELSDETRMSSTPDSVLTADRRARQFEFEAQILARLRHPRLPKVTDHFVILGQGQYLVMEYIEGRDLREIVTERGPLPPREVIGAGIQVCLVLEYLHCQKPPIIHRDIKPNNLRMTDDGRIFLVDFGISKTADAMRTSTGAVGLTHGYSPLEQYSERHTDERSDIYSLGATLCSLLTGETPPSATDRAMGKTPVRPLAMLRGINTALSAAIEKALSLVPEDRYQTAEEFRRALQRAAHEMGIELQDTGDTTLPSHSLLHPAGDVTTAKLTTSPPLAPLEPETKLETLHAPTPLPVPRKGSRRLLLAVVLVAAAFGLYFGLRGRGASPPRTQEVTAEAPPPSVSITTGGVSSAQADESLQVGVPATADPERSEVRTERVEHIGPTGQGASERNTSATPVIAEATTTTSPAEQAAADEAAVNLVAPIVESMSSTETSVTLSWSLGNSAALVSYEVHYATHAGFTASATTLFGTAPNRPGENRVTVTGLECGTTYYFLVRANCPGCSSADSAERPISTAPCPAPALTEPVLVSSAGDGQFTNLSDALDAVNTDATVRAGFRIDVRPGTYVLSKPLWIGRNVEITGEGAVLTSTVSQVVIMQTDRATLKGLTLRTTSASASAVNVPQGQLVLENCEISSMSRACVEVLNGAEVELKDCRIKASAAAGIFARDRGRGILSRCVVSDVERGAELTGGGEVTLSASKIVGCRGSGVVVKPGCRAVLEDCEVTGNGINGLSVRSGGYASLRRCNVKKNAMYAIDVEVGGSVVVADSDLADNPAGAVSDPSGTGVTRQGNVREE